jgi:hypothetical protein
MPLYPGLPRGQLEQQQTVLFEVLAKAAGKPVSHAQLRDAGVEFPASVASELELAGIEIEHCQLTAQPAGERLPALRLLPRRLAPAASTSSGTVPDDASELPPSVPPRTWSALARTLPELAIARSSGAITGSALGWRRARRGEPKGARGKPREAMTFAPPRPPGIGASRWLIAGALLAGAVAVLIIASLAGGGERGPKLSAGSRSSRSSRSGRTNREPGGSAHRGSASGTPQVAAAQASKPKAAPAPDAPNRPLPRTPVSATLATNLEAEGHTLLDAGRSSRAIPVLERALAATGEHPGACIESTEVACLEYAYALFDLGRARLELGEASAAAALLERRLRIDNQRPIVQAELEAARARLRHSGGA